MPGIASDADELVFDLVRMGGIGNHDRRGEDAPDRPRASRGQLQHGLRMGQGQQLLGSAGAGKRPETRAGSRRTG